MPLLLSKSVAARRPVFVNAQPQGVNRYLDDTDITDAGLMQLESLTQLRSLSLWTRDVTDTGLTHLKGLTELQILKLWETKVTDAGLVNLKGLSKLQVLDLAGSKVTNAGIKDLQKALPNCWINH
jgi:internalin A